MTDKMSLLFVSGTLDKMMAGSIIASGAVANDLEINVFFSFWGLMNLRKSGGLAPKMSYEAGEMEGPMMQIMKEKNVPSWLDMLRNAKEIGNIKVYACAMTADLLGITKDDLDPIVDDIVGVGEFVSMAKDGQILFM